MKFKRSLAGAACAALALTFPGADAVSFAAPSDLTIVMTEMGGYHSGALDAYGDLYLWGLNNCGQIGDGTVSSASAPKKILSNVKTFSLGMYHSAAVTQNGDLYTWGFNENSQLGNHNATDSHEPVKVLENVASVSLGESHSAAITENGDLYMWGSNWSGQLGSGNTMLYAVPVKVMSGVSSVSLGDSFSAAITNDGSLYMWGSNSCGKLGCGDTDDRLEPVRVMENVACVSLGKDHSAAVTKKGDLYTWGLNSSGQLGDGKDSSQEMFRSVPKKIMRSTATVSLGVDHSAAVSTAGAVYIWGYNSCGQLGMDVGGLCRLTPAKMKLPGTISSVSLGYYHTAALGSSGALYMWGAGYSFQLGLGGRSDKPTPSRLMGPAILPPQPSLIKSAAGAGQATVVCSSVSGAADYRLFYTVNNGASYVSVGNSKTRKWTVTGLSAGVEYKFLVLIYNGAEWSAYRRGDCFAPVVPTLPNPAAINSTAGAGQAEVVCSAVSGAVNYKLYYTADNGATYVPVGNSKSRRWTVKGLSSGVEYKFLVRVSDGTRWSAYKKGECYAPVTVM